MTPPHPEIVRADASLEEEVVRMFHEISSSGDSVLFHPHAFTPEYARSVCAYAGHDEYYVVMADGHAVGYGILRGWDEGFEIPSLGLWVSPSFRSKGLGRRLLNHLQDRAQLANAPRVRLTVSEENEPAINLYKSVGYDFKPVPGEKRLVGFLTF